MQRSYPFRPKEIVLLDKFERWRRAACLLKLSRKAKLRLEWVIFYHAKAQGNARLTCRHFFISPKTFYKWLSRFNEENLKLLEDQSKAPLFCRKPRYTPKEVQRIIDLRVKYPTLGRDKLQVIYQEDYGEEIKYWSLRRIIHAFKLQAQIGFSTKEKKQEMLLKKKRITELAKKPFSGFLLELDTIVIYFRSVKRYILTAVDYHSRFGFAFMYKSKHSKYAADFLKKLMVLYQGHVKNIHIDNGSEFRKEFEKAARKFNVELYHARPYEPQDKPLVERFNGILKQEYINLGNLTSDAGLFNHDLLEWILFYNFKRPHHSLGLKRPIDYVNMKTKVLPMYPPMTLIC